MTNQRVVLREIDWLALFPWLKLTQAYTVATRLPVILVSLLAYYLVPLVWLASRSLFLADDKRSIEEIAETLTFGSSFTFIGGSEFVLTVIKTIYLHTIMPFEHAVSAETTGEAAYFVFGGLGSLIIWALAAGVITRISVVHVGRQERVLLKEALAFVKRRSPSYVLAPLFPLGAVALMWLALSLLGLPLRFANVYGWVLAILWVLILLLSWSIAFLLIGLGIGWPLMWPTVSAEKTGDMFEATSRSFSYIMQRPLHGLWYLLVGIVIGNLGLYVVQLISTTTLSVSDYAVGMFAGPDWADLKIGIHTRESLSAIQTTMIQYVSAPIRDLPMIFACSYFWSMMGIIYLLLRRATDQIDMDEVYLEDEQVRYGLPPLEADEQGVPGVSEE